MSKDYENTGVDEIFIERARQHLQGWTNEHDDQHIDGSLAIAGAMYALTPLLNQSEKIGELTPRQWPWDSDSWKPSIDDRIKELRKAGALIAAEIDRLKRLENG